MLKLFKRKKMPKAATPAPNSDPNPALNSALNPAPSDFTGYSNQYTFVTAGGRVGIYQGYWVLGLPEGSGIWQETVDEGLGRKYDGGWKSGQFEGRGIYTWPSGHKYEGEFLAGNIEGKGVKTWINGEQYDGEFRAGVKEGKGIYTWPSGHKYEGEYLAGKPEGKGIRTWPDGAHYVGEFKGGALEGEGTYTTGMKFGKGQNLSSPRQFSGTWVQDKLNGLSVSDLDEAVQRLGSLSLSSSSSSFSTSPTSPSSTSASTDGSPSLSLPLLDLIEKVKERETPEDLSNKETDKLIMHISEKKKRKKKFIDENKRGNWYRKSQSENAFCSEK